MLAPSSLISLTFLMFLADLSIFLRESLSEIIRTFDSLFLFKKLLNSFVFFISFVTSAKI